MTMIVKFRLNGKGNAFLQELGCTCDNCLSNSAKAQTSGSLLIYEELDGNKQLKYHLLFDCGLGVVDSLISGGIGAVSHVFISHNHADHLLELDRLFQSNKRSFARANREIRVPCYCTAETRRTGPDKHFGYLDWDRIDVTPGIPVVPCEFLRVGCYCNPGLGINLLVTPVKVYHGNPNIVPNPVIWVIEYDEIGSDETVTHRKIVLGWDLLHLVPRYPGEDADTLYTGATGVTNTPDPSHNILFEPDILILEANTVEPHPETGHTSLDAALHFTVPFIKPKQETWIVHYSGHEDSLGGLAPADLQVQIATICVMYGVDPSWSIVLPFEGKLWP